MQRSRWPRQPSAYSTATNQQWEPARSRWRALTAAIGPPGEAGGVEGVGAVGHQQVALAVRFGVDPGTLRALAGGDHRQQVVRHRVAVGRVVVPHLDRDPLPHLRGDEVPGEAEAGVEAPVVADLKRHPGLADAGAQLLALLDGGAQRLLDEDVLAGGDRLKAQGDVERVAGGDDDRLHPGVGQHGGVVAVGNCRFVHGSHLLDQVPGGVADGVELGVAPLAAGVEVGHLGDRPAAENAYPEEAVLPGAGITGHGRGGCQSGAPYPGLGAGIPFPSGRSRCRQYPVGSPPRAMMPLGSRCFSKRTSGGL